MYSLAALPSITRAAPAKKRRLSTVTGISSIAAATGLPAFFDSRRPSSSARASSPSASFRRARLRSAGVVCCQVSKAVAAASTARSTSSALGRLDLGDDLAVGRVLDVERRARGRVDPLAADELLVGLDALEDVGHRGASCACGQSSLTDVTTSYAAAEVRPALRSRPGIDPYATGWPVRATRSMRSAARTVPGLAFTCDDSAARRRWRAVSASSSSIASVSSSSRKS